MELPQTAIARIVQTALDEDMGRGDITTDACLDAAARGRARVVARQPLVFCGLAVMREVYRQVDAGIEVEQLCEEGQLLQAGEAAAEIRGRSISILKGETTVIPEAVAPVSATDRMLDRFLNYGKYVGYCLGGIVVIVLLIVLFRLLGRGITNFRVPWWFRRIPVIGRYARYGDRVSDAAYSADYTRRQAGRYVPDVKGLDRKGEKGKGRPTAFLEVIQSSSKVPGRIDLDVNEIRFGRSSKQADLAFSKDTTVSRIHATIVQEGGVHRVFDEQSTSGTFVNEQRVPSNGLQLVDGDEIRMGGVKLRYRQP